MKPSERLRAEKNGEKLLPDHLRCPNSNSDYGMSEPKSIDTPAQIKLCLVQFYSLGRQNYCRFVDYAKVLVDIRHEPYQRGLFSNQVGFSPSFCYKLFKQEFI